MSKRQKGLAAIITCVFFWGFSFIATKVSVAVFPPFSLGMLRFGIAIVVLFFIKLKLAPGEKIKIRDFPRLFGAGIFGVTLYFFCENNGVSLVSASEASIAVSSIPVLVMITDWVGSKISGASGSPVKGRQWLGALTSISGVWLVAGVSLVISGSIRGYIFMTGAALSWVTYSFLTRTLASYSRIVIVFWQSVAGFICFVPFSVSEFSRWGKPGINVIAGLLFLGICCSAFGYLCYVYALKNLGVSVCAVFINMIPMVTVICGFILLGDRLSVLQWLGAALVVSGVYLAMWEKKPRPETSGS